MCLNSIVISSWVYVWHAFVSLHRYERRSSASFGFPVREWLCFQRYRLYREKRKRQWPVKWPSSSFSAPAACRKNGASFPLPAHSRAACEERGTHQGCRSTACSQPLSPTRGHQRGGKKPTRSSSRRPALERAERGTEFATGDANLLHKRSGRLGQSARRGGLRERLRGAFSCGSGRASPWRGALLLLFSYPAVGSFPALISPQCGRMLPHALKSCSPQSSSKIALCIAHRIKSNPSVGASAPRHAASTTESHSKPIIAASIPRLNRREPGEEKIAGTITSTRERITM